MIGSVSACGTDRERCVTFRCDMDQLQRHWVHHTPLGWTGASFCVWGKLVCVFQALLTPSGICTNLAWGQNCPQPSERDSFWNICHRLWWEQACLHINYCMLVQQNLKTHTRTHTHTHRRPARLDFPHMFWASPSLAKSGMPQHKACWLCCSVCLLSYTCGLKLSQEVTEIPFGDNLPKFICRLYINLYKHNHNIHIN